MKTKTIFLSVATLLSLLISEKATAQIGEPYIHDPSTIMECEGKYYTFGTGGGGLISEDGWTWNSGGVRPGRGALFPNLPSKLTVNRLLNTLC